MQAMRCARPGAQADLPGSPAAGKAGVGVVSLRRRARHSRRLVVGLTDEARTAYLACRDAEVFRRWHTHTPCAPCRCAETGICSRYGRDLKLADGYAGLRAQLDGRLPTLDQGTWCMSGDRAGEDLMTRREVAFLFRATSQAVAAWARRGRLTEVRNSEGKPRYRRAEVEELFGACPTGESQREPARGRPVSRPGGRMSSRWSPPAIGPKTVFSRRMRSSGSSLCACAGRPADLA